MKPITVWLADDLTLFLPLDPKEVIAYQGGDKAFNACFEHEKKLKSERQ